MQEAGVAIVDVLQAEEEELSEIMEMLLVAMDHSDCHMYKFLEEFTQSVRASGQDVLEWVFSLTEGLVYEGKDVQRLADWLSVKTIQQGDFGLFGHAGLDPLEKLLRYEEHAQAMRPLYKALAKIAELYTLVDVEKPFLSSFAFTALVLANDKENAERILDEYMPRIHEEMSVWVYTLPEGLERHVWAEDLLQEKVEDRLIAIKLAHRQARRGETTELF